MATKKTAKTKATKKVVEKAVKETTSKITKAVKTAAKEAEKVVEKVATKTATAKSAAKTAVKTVAKTATKTAAKPVAKIAAKVTAKASAKASAKSAPKASEQTDVVLKSTARKSAKSVKVTAPKAAAKPVTKTASMAQNFDPEYLVLMQKDPNWMQAFWEVSEDRIKRAKKGKGKLVLRLFDISDDLTVKRSKKRKFHDVVVPADARSWYVENKATSNTVAVLGFAQGKNFMPLVESVPVQAYSPEGSQVNVDDVFVKASLGGAAMGGFGSSGLSSMSAKNWLENALGTLSSSSGSMFSGALSSAALKSNKLELPKDSVNYGKDFFLWVKTRLIVYGGTRPDAHLQVRGEPFPLNPDGTFSFEEDLPDSTKIIPVFATDKDGDFPTTIVPIVVKRTE
ncbi:MAG: DUF4912 domain-containing protein [Fibrobacter sp.]|nr:DUF4912 domain-containing protein [Fibrobacter sp.]